MEIEHLLKSLEVTERHKIRAQKQILKVTKVFGSGTISKSPESDCMIYRPMVQNKTSEWAHMAHT